jgi:trimeric autotransporter adhesin
VLPTDDNDAEQSSSDQEAIRYTGFIAQEVEKVANETGFDFSGVDEPKNDQDLYGLRYAEFVVPLVKAVQEQQAIIERLEKRIAELERR